MGSRRDFLRGLLAAGAALPFASLACKGEQGSRKPPRKIVVIFLAGGTDGVLTMDPKTPKEVHSWVDNPLPNQTVEAGNLRFGALWAPLAKWAHQMSIIQGVRVETANHFAGQWQFVRLRRRALMNTPGILDLVARHHEAPLGAISVGDMFTRTYTPSWVPVEGSIVGPFPRERQGLAMLDSVPASERKELKAVLWEYARDPSLSGPDRDSYARVARYLELIDKSNTFKEEDWKIPNPEKYTGAIAGLQRVLWAFEHDAASAALVYFGFNTFDSHWANMDRQQKGNGAFVAAFERFLNGLHARSNRHGRLAEQTLIVVGSELGRYPRLNSDIGKDHYPETSLLLAGAGVNGGTLFGQTDKAMLGVPIDLATGKLGGNRYVTLDDIGTTVLRIMGIEPTQYGYPAHPIEPVIA